MVHQKQCLTVLRVVSRIEGGVNKDIHSKHSKQIGYFSRLIHTYCKMKIVN